MYINKNTRLFNFNKGLKQVSEFLSNFTKHWTGWSRSKNTRLAGRKYFTGIILPGKRKNMSGISKRVKLDKNVVQQFITDSPWNADEFLKTNIRIMSKETANEDGVLVIDDSGQKKKGNKSPGVKRQYSGTLGMVGNCQVFVTSWYCIPKGIRNADTTYWPTGMNLYIPKEWFDDEDRCREAGIPKDLEFKTKQKIALDLIEKTCQEEVPHKAITADAAYGNDSKFRKELRDLEEPYVFAVTPSNISVIPEDTALIPAGRKSRNGRIRKYPALPADLKPKTANVVRKEIRDKDWQRIEWSEGTKGTLSGLFARERVRVITDDRPSDETGWLLFERRKGIELKAYICWGFDDVPIEELVRIAHIRWFAEQGFKQMKGELGLDEFEGRSWKGWHHHAAMVTVAFSYLILIRSLVHQNNDKLPTLPKVREEMARIIVRKALERKFNISPEEADAFLDDEPYLIPQ